MIDTDMVVGTGLRITVPKDELVSALGVVSRADAARGQPGLLVPGRLVSDRDGRVIMAATDADRLAGKDTEGDGSGPEVAAIVPRRAVHVLARTAPDGETVELRVHHNQVLLSLK